MSKGAIKRRDGPVMKKSFHCMNGPWIGNVLMLESGSTLIFTVTDKDGCKRTGRYVRNGLNDLIWEGR